MPPPQFAPPTHPEILSPVPLPMPARPPSPGRSSSSPETVIYEDTGDSRLRFFQAKAADSMRYIVQREETTKERDEKELRQELKGKRVWRVGGIGIWAYSQDSALEEKKRQIWREENGKGDWLSSARARTKLYTESRGVKPPVMWKLVEGSDIPRDALPIGQEADGAPLYSARAWHEGGLHLGK
jgi:hypothetical protein